RRQSRTRKEPVMDKPTTYVGIDAHKRELHLAMLMGASDQLVRWTCPNEPRAVERLCRKLHRDAPGVIECCFAAGPTGYALHRSFPAAAGRRRIANGSGAWTGRNRPTVTSSATTTWPSNRSRHVSEKSIGSSSNSP